MIAGVTLQTVARKEYLHGILVGREVFPDGILYASCESHYSVFKAARMYRMDCVKVDCLVSGEIDSADFKVKLLANKDRPAIMNGQLLKEQSTTFDLVIQTLEECGFSHDKFYIHCDGALFGLMMPFVKLAPKVTFKKPIGSVSVSGHKFVGISAMLNELSSTVVFERPKDEEFVRRWQLACEGNIAHVVVMPSVTIEKLDDFLNELVEQRSTRYQDGTQPPCIAADVRDENCICPTHK